METISPRPFGESREDRAHGSRRRPGRQSPERRDRFPSLFDCRPARLQGLDRRGIRTRGKTEDGLAWVGNTCKLADSETSKRQAHEHRRHRHQFSPPGGGRRAPAPTAVRGCRLHAEEDTRPTNATASRLRSCRWWWRCLERTRRCAGAAHLPRAKSPVVGAARHRPFRGGAPHGDGVLLSLRENAAHPPHRSDGRTARVQPGVTISRSRMRRRCGLFYAPDLLADRLLDRRNVAETRAACLPENTASRCTNVLRDARGHGRRRGRRSRQRGARLARLDLLPS